MTRIRIPNDYPVELTPPDISAYRKGNTGIDYVHRIASDRPGPHVGITAIVHGNEPCGAIALDWLLRHDIRPERGTLTLAFVNTEAYARFDPADPNASRWLDQDLNRVWSPEVLDGQRTSREIERARALRPVIDEIDLLLDIHSMQHATEPLMLAGPLLKGRELAKQVGVPSVVVSDAGHDAGRRMRDHGGFADPASTKNALLAECGQHWEAAAGPRAIETALRFLRATGVVDEACGADFLAARPTPASQRFIEVTEAVTIQTDRFAFAEPYRGLEVIAEAGTRIATDGERAILTPELRPDHAHEAPLAGPDRRPPRPADSIEPGRKTAMCVPGCHRSIVDRLSRRRLFTAGAAFAATAAITAPRAPAFAQSPPTFSRVVDLTHTLPPDFPTYPGVPGLTMNQRHALAADGYNELEWQLVEHTGTHLDAPFHFSEGGLTADAIPIENLVVPLAIIDIAFKAADDPDAQVTPDDIRAWIAANGAIPDGACVAMRSGWERFVTGDRFRNADSDGVMHFPGFHVEAAQLLMEEANVTGIAVDTLSLDFGRSADFATHYAWLPSNRWGLECVANLAELPASGAILVVGAPKIQGATGGPSRVIALV